MSTLMNSFGPEETERLPIPANDNSSAHRLPASWYSSQDMHELERRAIFSRKWLLTTHKLRFPKTGDWLRYNIAGYAFILVKDREGNVNAFHNVCRHRAFPVVTEEGGTSRIFSCQYHGWSYGLNGKLAKAPGYQELEGFDKSKNGLLPIHVHLDVNGFVWVNLDAGEKPEISWEDDFKGIDLQPRFEGFNSKDYNFDHAWEMSGDYNWKILADNYNNSYIPSLSNLSLYTVDNEDGKSTPEEIAKGLKTASTYYFPNAALTVSSHFFFMQRLLPTGPTTCLVRYEVYRNKNSSDDEFEMINQISKRMMSENKDLCVEKQKNLNTGVSVNGHPYPTEEGSVDFQTVVRGLITEHRKREENAGEQLWPARQRLPQEEAVSKEDMDFCSKLTSHEGSALTGCCGGGCGGGPPTIAATAPETMVV
ncbi:Aromatic-ring-hydroxylating dioxygenase, alpha subunit [Penicillium italicum]|uniref:Choline monooxygenase, chloroplastic n=1 Tax=Penicillium italicum TaxID=40296 RepID=A0A0A2L5Q8_PENIT|nr:Aromatic-ring-hydroxylating dioxygenase, alpha subunit [Penicillium italicum]